MNYKTYQKEWREVNFDKKKIENKTWHQKHPNKAKEYREAHLDTKKTIDKTWRKANPDKVNAIWNKRHATKLKAIPKNLTKDHLEEIEYIYKEASRLQKSDGIKRHVHHVIPLQEFNDLGIFGEHAPWTLEILTEEEHKEVHRKLKLKYRDNLNI